jgi:hypothetical protein
MRQSKSAWHILSVHSVQTELPDHHKDNLSHISFLQGVACGETAKY